MCSTNTINTQPEERERERKGTNSMPYSSLRIFHGSMLSISTLIALYRAAADF